MPEFKDVKTFAEKFGKNNFLEVALKKVISDKGENEFVSISRGFITDDGQRRYQKALTIPRDLIDFVCEKLQEIK